MKTTVDIQRELAEPFDPFDIEWRVQVCGTTAQNKLYAVLVPYVTNRAVQERLDVVMGIDGWKNEFTDTPSGKGTLCGISLKFDDWITKWDGAEDTAVEATKGGISSAMKRAAVQWGIGRYLYRLDSAIVTPQKDRPQAMEDWIMAQVKLDGRKERIYFKRPKLPTWAV